MVTGTAGFGNCVNVAVFLPVGVLGPKWLDDLVIVVRRSPSELAPNASGTG